MSKKIKIFRAYITRDKKTTAQDIADQFKVTRRAVHQAVEEMRNGSKKKIADAMSNHKKWCLWKAHYQPWYEAIGEFRGNEQLTDEFRYLVWSMKNAGFSAAEIARFLERDHATIRYHLKKV